MAPVRILLTFLYRCLSNRSICANCHQYRPWKGICGVYFLYNKQVVCMRCNPWDECLLGDLEEEVQSAELDTLKELSRQAKKEVEEYERRESERDSKGQANLSGGGDGTCNEGSSNSLEK